MIANEGLSVEVACRVLSVSGAGFVRTRTTALLTIEETDRALATKINYRKPGG